MQALHEVGERECTVAGKSIREERKTKYQQVKGSGFDDKGVGKRWRVAGFLKASQLDSWTAQ